MRVREEADSRFDRGFPSPQQEVSDVEVSPVLRFCAFPFEVRLRITFTDSFSLSFPLRPPFLFF